jgi:hypothetical protein
MELGRSERPMMTNDADVGFAWSGRRRASADLRLPQFHGRLGWNGDERSTSSGGARRGHPTACGRERPQRRARFRVTPTILGNNHRQARVANQSPTDLASGMWWQLTASFLPRQPQSYRLHSVSDSHSKHPHQHSKVFSAAYILLGYQR